MSRSRMQGKYYLLGILLFVLICFFSVSVYAGDTTNVYTTATISAENSWSGVLSVPLGKTVVACINPNSNSDMTITLQVQFRDEYLAAPDTWNYDVDSWVITGSLEDQINQPKAFSEWVRYRIGCKTGDYTSGNCTVRLSRGAGR